MTNVDTREAVSLARLTAVLDGDESGAREVLGLFLKELPRFEQALRGAQSPQDLAKALHRFRGSLLSLGLADAAEPLSAYETAATTARVLDTQVVEAACALVPILTRQTEAELK